jgi:hypothetical protein
LREGRQSFDIVHHAQFFGYGSAKKAGITFRSGHEQGTGNTEYQFLMYGTNYSLDRSALTGC